MALHTWCRSCKRITKRKGLNCGLCGLKFPDKEPVNG